MKMNLHCFPNSVAFISPLFEKSSRIIIEIRFAKQWDSTLEKTFDHIFPRIAAYAETAWSKQSAKDYTNFKYRLSPMWDLWKARGIYVGGMDEKNYPGPGW